ncbi:hypothetical protein DO021_06550 [Desulfobacter hydrogenophilus]|uniref:PEP-CTERM sorting domain-containing protein n=1 Tax=Desulfobacter hydrogenophilus TaxID=2291 RepID=A0A328FHB8_9BACT|nr:PEP-CTERM sorting domain-containing protein [Desulfobacter hydrogenophilus]NDY71204.1 PEP-CTERM sorting domain-containing protein [Desulfobacter hydrogenophilus]QBH14199.1 PEP-CTERM sorting domain-containing protein [Desulfobacter hydrogenophilus]RAM02872.1 hypothetical protein DO021_06550 [Desulfobacter hydrogenophilus]
MKKLMLFLCICFFVVGGTPAFAMTIDVWEVKNENISMINGWIGDQHGSVHVLEDFEDIDAGWYTEKRDTGVGTFTAGGEIGKGASSYNIQNNLKGSHKSDEAYFSIQDRDSDWYRNNMTTSEGASQWLDSGDITLLTLTLTDTSLTNLFFYIQDPADYNTTTMFVNNDANNNYKFSHQANKTSFFVGISWADDEVLSTLSWATTSQSDGFGLDDFSTIQNPEPATMLLFGFGLIGIAGITRRMI